MSDAAVFIGMAALVGAIAWRSARGFAEIRGFDGVAEVALNAAARVVPSKSPSAVDLQRATWGAIRIELTVREGIVFVPPCFEVHLHPRDLVAVNEVGDWFRAGLLAVIAGKAKGPNWRLVSSPRIELCSDPSCRVGVPVVRESGISRPARSDGLGDASIGSETLIEPLQNTLLVGSGGACRCLPGSIIGRSRRCQVVLTDATVSGEHCRIDFDARGWTIVDLGSTNGTLLSGRRLRAGTPNPLVDRSELTLGATQLRFCLAAPMSESARPTKGQPVQREEKSAIRNAAAPGPDQDASVMMPFQHEAAQSPLG